MKKSKRKLVFELNKNRDKKCKILWDAARAILRENFALKDY
jgi:hypothetical protein